jgi:hypothetical protein
MKQGYSFSRGSLVLGLSLMLAGLSARAQAPSWQAARLLIGVQNGASRTNAMATDASGNVYVAGYTSYDTHAPYSRMVVSKYNSSGTLLWTLGDASTSSTTEATGLAVSGNSVYVTGTCLGPAQFGSIQIDNGTFGSRSFVAKITDAGSSASYTWAAGISGHNGTNLPTVAADGSNVYVAGNFIGTATLGPTSLSSTGGKDIFVAKLADAGPSYSWIWAQQVGGTGEDLATAISTNGPSVYLAGTFSGSTSVGSIPLTSAGGTDGFVAKLTDTGSSGNVAWARAIGGTGADQLRAVLVSGTQVYLAGKFFDTVGFDASSLSSAGGADGFVAQLNDAGSSAGFGWAQRVGGPSEDQLTALSMNSAGLYLTGSFQGTASVGSTTLTAAPTASGGVGTNILVARFREPISNPQFAWAQQAGNSPIGSNEGYAVAVSSSGMVHVGGRVGAQPQFGSLTPAGSSAVYSDGFYASLSDAAALATQSARGSLALSLAPNPAHGRATVQLPGTPGTTKATLTLSDALGRVVRSLALPLPAAGLRHELDLSGLAPGIYVLRGQAGAAYAVSRLVVE